MKQNARNGLLVGAGFLIGTLGIKALTSKPAKQLYVQGVAKGLQAKTCYEEIVEEAKAQVDDIVSEASYLNSTRVGADGCGASDKASNKVSDKIDEKPAE
ncbi:MAG: DUF6110 family protein [Coriobacteriales bacterium]|nr:DUF6110 family protein [Coriobacteriales bacterium]